MFKLVKRCRLMRLCLCLAILILSGYAAGEFLYGSNKTENLAGESFAFVHVNVIPMDRERVLMDQTVIVTDGRISKIGAATKTKVPKGATEIDGAGKYLIPALSDMHVHIIGMDC